MLNSDVQNTMNSEVDEAARLLEQGQVVGIPTETVYGLAARLDRPEGLQKVFSIKDRPFFDPLIVHVDSVAMARRYVKVWSEICSALAQSFWPGPLSLVLPKSSLVPDLVTAGLPSVAIRLPRNNKTLKLIGQCGVGLAAPSANRFGRTSPTEGKHVDSEFGGRVFVIHDMPAEIGIESTVLKIDGSRLRILRPGMVTRAQIESCLRGAKLEFTWDFSEAGVSGESPGQLKHHYMPELPLVWVEGEKSVSEIADAVKMTKGIELQLSQDPRLAARELYGRLRQCSEAGGDFIYFRRLSSMAGEAWQAILDRLNKAATQRVESSVSGC